MNSLKIINLLIYLFISVQSFALSPDTCFTQKEISKIAFVIDSLDKNLDDTEYELGLALDIIKDYEQKTINDSIIISTQKYQILSLRTQILYKDEIIESKDKQIQILQPKWYENPYLWGGMGSALTIVVFLLVTR